MLAKNCLAKSLKQFIWHLSYQNKEKATSAITFVKHQPRQINYIEIRLTHRHNDSPQGASLQIRGLVKPEPYLVC